MPYGEPYPAYPEWAYNLRDDLLAEIVALGVRTKGLEKAIATMLDDSVNDFEVDGEVDWEHRERGWRIAHLELIVARMAVALIGLNPPVPAWFDEEMESGLVRVIRFGKDPDPTGTWEVYFEPQSPSAATKRRRAARSIPLTTALMRDFLDAFPKMDADFPECEGWTDRCLLPEGHEGLHFDPRLGYVPVAE